MPPKEGQSMGDCCLCCSLVIHCTCGYDYFFRGRSISCHCQARSRNIQYQGMFKTFLMQLRNICVHIKFLLSAAWPGWSAMT